ncbi:hypothetical protein CsatB_006803 [Cannabis sativa]
MRLRLQLFYRVCLSQTLTLEGSWTFTLKGHIFSFGRLGMISRYFLRWFDLHHQWFDLQLVLCMCIYIHVWKF